MSPVSCYHCGKEIPSTGLGRQDSCDHCGRDTRVCRNCRHYDRSANNECREEQAGRQVEKEKGNFCEWFQPGSLTAPSSNGPGRDALRSKADALFAKKPAGDPAPLDSAKAAAEALFKKKS